MHNVPRQEFASEPVPVLPLKRHFNRRPIRFRFRLTPTISIMILLSSLSNTELFVLYALRWSYVEWYLQNQARWSGTCKIKVAYQPRREQMHCVPLPKLSFASRSPCKYLPTTSEGEGMAVAGSGSLSPKLLSIIPRGGADVHPYQLYRLP